MNDEFLHRLRKEPRPEFAARLRSQLRRQSSRPLAPRAPSRARTLLTLLLLGGTAFAITAVAMKGLHWGAPESSSPRGAASHSGRTTQSAAPTVSARSTATPSGASPGGSAPVGASGLQIAQIRAVSSWAAYPYAAAMAERINATSVTSSVPTVPQIDVSIRHSNVALVQMCTGDADAPDMLYTFAPPEAMSDHPCPRDASGNPSLVIAIPVSHEVLALARSPLYGAPDLTLRQVFLALAKWVPDPARAAAVRENFYTSWRQIDAAFGQESIQIMGPPLSSPAGRSVIGLLMEGGCDTYPWIAALAASDPKQYARICRTVRTDGVYMETSSLSPPNLLAQPNAIGVVGGPYGPNVYGLAVSRLDGVALTRQTVASGEYPGSRVFYLVVNRRRVAPYVMMRLLNAAWHIGYPSPTSDWAIVAPTMLESQAAINQVLGP